MDRARADALFARNRIVAEGWIAPKAESFRHLPPPAADVWLGDAPDVSDGCAAPPLAGAGWTLHPVGDTLQGRVDARWLDARDHDQRRELFDGLATLDSDDAAPFAWAHRALVRRGLRLRIGGAPGGSAGRAERQTVWLQLRRQPRAQVEAPLLVIELLPGVRCVLIESHVRESTLCGHAVVQNLQVHVHLGADAALHHLRIATPGSGDRVAHHVHAQLARDAQYHQALIGTGSDYHLQRSVFELAGARAHAHCAGVLFANGSALDQQVRMRHVAPGSHGTVETLALAGNGSRVIVDAHSRIAPGADDAVVHQRLSGIPTAGRPKVVLRPHLEIHHDKVQAAHGATWGKLPEDALFYAAQRGLDEHSARALIVEGMARAALAASLDTAGLMETLGVDALLASTVARHLEKTHG